MFFVNSSLLVAITETVTLLGTTLSISSSPLVKIVLFQHVDTFFSALEKYLFC
jgi:hypothetical protein